MKILLMVICVLLFSTGTLFAKTPSETASEYFNALKQKDYDQAAAFFDPAALGEFRSMMSFLLELPEESREQVVTAFFGPGTTKDTISKMSDTRFFATFLRSIMAQAEGAAGGVAFEKMEILGEVMEGKDIAHVVTRSRVTVGEIEVEAMKVVSFKRSDKGWKALMSGNIKGFAQQIKSALKR